MNFVNSFGELSEITKEAVEIKKYAFVIKDIVKLKQKLPELINFSANETGKSKALYYLALTAAYQSGIYLSSLQKLYKAKGNGSVQHDFTIPVIDCTKDPLELVQQITRAQKSMDFGLCCFGMKIDDEINDNHYAFITKILSAALLENYVGPIFFHAGNINFDKKRFNNSRENLMDVLRVKVKSLINAGIYNITLDSSELFEENRAELLEKLLMNLKMVAMVTNLWVRNFEPRGINVAVGSVLRLFDGQELSISILKEYLKRLFKEGSRLRFNTPGEEISKIMVNNNDKESLKTMNKMVKKEYGMGGLVLNLGEVSDINAIQELKTEDFCEINFKFSNSLKNASNYSSIFSLLVNSDLKNKLNEFLLYREFLPKFNEL